MYFATMGDEHEKLRIKAIVNSHFIFESWKWINAYVHLVGEDINDGEYNMAKWVVWHEVEKSIWV